MGTLYVVGIPAGNLEDVTQRALRVLREVDLIVAQDIPQAQELLAYYGIDTPLAGTGCTGNETTSENVKVGGSEDVLERLTHSDVALLSTEGLLGRPDPAWWLVRTAVERGIAVVSVPGPPAAVTALVTSGLPVDAYLSLGFLPQGITQRRKLLGSQAVERRTLVAFETSSRLLVALRDVAETLGHRPLSLSPLRAESDEAAWRGTVDEAAAHFEANPPRGEWALVIGGARGKAARWPEGRVQSELERLLVKGLGRKEAARLVAEVSGWRPREVYRLAAQGRFHV